MIPASAYTPLLRISFGMLALRRGPHWQLRTVSASETPFGEALDEADLLAEAIAGVMKHVPLPARELGIVSDLTTAGLAFYAVLAPRIQLDREVAAIRASGHEVRFVRPGEETPPAARPMPPAGENGSEQTAADVMRSLGDTPLLAEATHFVAPDREQTGDPIVDGLQLGHAPTAELAATDDPEPVLFEAFRPGERPARVQDLINDPTDDRPLLERLAPPPEVDGSPAEREL